MPQSTKKEKKQKTFSTKKLPSLLKKAYTQKKLNKKILNKLFIPSDKEYIQSLFTENGINKKGEQLFSISKELTFTKNEKNRLKKITKEIKKQKGRIKLIPLLAVAIFITALILGITLTKNIIAKKIITSTVETITQARCDIKKVDIKFFDSTFKMQGLEIANKAEPMKNYVSISSIVLDFDLLQLLKSRFVVNNFAVDGVELNSTRTYDGTLPPKKAKKIKKEKEKSKKSDDEQPSPLVASLKQKTDNSLGAVSSSLTQTFAQYKPEEILNTFYANLQTPQIAQKVQKEIEPLTIKYTELAKTLEEEKNNAEQVVQSVASINYSELYKEPIVVNSKIDPKDIQELQKANSQDYFKDPKNIAKIVEIINKYNIKNPDDIKKMIEITPSSQITQTLNTLSSTYDYTLDLQKKVESSAKEITNDAKNIQKLSSEVQSVLKNDTKYVQSEIQKISSFKLNDGANFLSGTFDTIGYSLLGKYYPYAQKIINNLENTKSTKSKSAEAPKKDKKKKRTLLISRQVGRTVTYENDTTPSLWIKNIQASGTNFSGKVQNITNNMDAINKTTTGEIALKLFNVNHSANVIVDTRTKSQPPIDSPLVNISYNADTIPVSLPLSYFNNTPGVPGIEHSNVELKTNLVINNKNSFSISGQSTFTDLKLNTTEFEPQFISQIYSNILNQISDMKVDFTSSYSLENNLILSFESDIDKKLMLALENEMKNQLNTLKIQIEKEVIQKLNELTKGTLGEINNLSDIQNKATEYSEYITKLPDEINKKQNELQDVVKKAVTETQNEFTDAIKQAQMQLQKQIQDKLEAEVNEKKKELEAETKKILQNQLKKLF